MTTLAEAALDDRWVADDVPGANGLDTPWIWNLDGNPWYEAPTPRWLHRCSAQTIGCMDLRRIERCACGATRVGLSWIGRNETRRFHVRRAVRRVFRRRPRW